MMRYLLLLASVLLGALIVLILKPSKKTVRLLLAFSGAYLLSVAILHYYQRFIMVRQIITLWGYVS